MTNVKCQIKVLLYKIIIPFPLLYNIIIVAGSRLLVGAFVIFNLTLVITAETAAAPSPLWAKSGIVINDTLGNSPEQKPKIISDPAGGYILVWEDGRGGATNVYAQKLSEASTPLWTNMGIAVSQSPKNQNSPQVISDQSGGAIIVWQDFRSDKADIFAQKINSSGQLVWGNVGLPICTEKSGQFSPQITSDGAGGAIIVWHDYRSGKGEDIFAQKIDSKGNLLWQQDGLPISTAASTQWYPQISGDGQGGAIIVWTDGRAGAADNNIYAQHISTSGQTIWEKDGIPICSAPKNQERPVILGVSGGAIIAWEDSRFNNLDIFAQKITNDGNPGWEKDGRRICQASGQQEKPTLCPDCNEGVIIAWTDYRAPASDIYAQRVQDSGKILWAEDGTVICSFKGNQQEPAIAKIAKKEEWVIVWEDKRSGDVDLYAQKINAASTLMWQGSGIEVAKAQNSQGLPAIAASPNNGIVIAWEDKRSGNYDLYAQKISQDGLAGWGAADKAISNSLGSVVQQKVDAVDNGQGEIILIFEDARSGYLNLYAQKINTFGNLSWGQNGLAVAKIEADQNNAKIIPDNVGGAIIAWEDQRSGAGTCVRLQRLSSTGKHLWPTSQTVCPLKANQSNPKLIPDGEGGAIIIWQDDRNLKKGPGIFAQRVSPAGLSLWEQNGTAVAETNNNQKDAAIISDGSGGAIIAWTDYRRGERNPDIYAQRINSQGAPLWAKDGLEVCTAPDVQRSPYIIKDNQGGAIISWTDKGGGSYDIYAQRISSSGQALWRKDGIPINQASRSQQNAKFANSKIIVWEDYRYGNWDIFAQSVSAQGKTEWLEEGIPIATLAKTQFAPQTAAWKAGSAIIVWEDYRNGQNYTLYTQKIAASGKLDWLATGEQLQPGRGAQILADTDDSHLYVFWEEFSGGGRAIYGQKYLVN